MTDQQFFDLGRGFGEAIRGLNRVIDVCRAARLQDMQRDAEALERLTMAAAAKGDYVVSIEAAKRDGDKVE